MRYTCILLLVLGSLVTFNAGAQSDSLNYNRHWQSRFIIGGNIPITKFSKNNFTDQFTGYYDRSVYVQVFSISFFIKKHWGGEIASHFVVGVPGQSQQRNFNFLKAHYPDYFISPTISSSESSILYPALNVGLLYRIAKGRMFYIPKFGVGITGPMGDSTVVTLKQENTNNVVRATFRPSKTVLVTYTGSASIGYRVGEHVILGCEAGITYARSKASLQQVISAERTNEVTVTNYSYEGHLISLNVGAQLIVMFGRR